MHLYYIVVLLATPLASRAAPPLWPDLRTHSTRFSGPSIGIERTHFPRGGSAREIPMPLSHPHPSSGGRVAHHSSQTAHRTTQSPLPHVHSIILHGSHAGHKRPKSKHAARSTAGASTLAAVNQLGAYKTSMMWSSSALANLASTPNLTTTAGSLFEQQSFAQLLTFQQALENYSNVFSSFGADKGITDLDRGNGMEFSMNEVVTYVKDALKNVDSIMYEVPSAGGTLGPMMYEIKCTVDEMLDGLENLSEGTLDSLGINFAVFKPELQSLSVQATSSVCGSDVPSLSSLGICA